MPTPITRRDFVKTSLLVTAGVRAALLDKTVPGNLNLHQKAYRPALSNPHLSAAISNMADEKQTNENLAVVRLNSA